MSALDKLLYAMRDAIQTQKELAKACEEYAGEDYAYFHADQIEECEKAEQHFKDVFTQAVREVK